MPQKLVEVLISESGEVKIVVHNAVGKECEALTADIEEALGTITKKARTPDSYKQEQKQNQEQRQ